MAKKHQANLQCVIPCGGNSTRFGQKQNKCLVDINGKPVLEHIVNFWKAYGISEFIYIVGGDSASAVAGCANRLNSKPIIINRGMITNLTKAISLANEYIKDRFVLALGDCLNIGEFTTTFPSFGVGVCMAELYELKKSYLVQLDGTGVAKLVEKPKKQFGLCGMGTLLFDRRIFDYIDRLKLSEQATSVDLTGAIQLAIGSGEIIKPVFFKGEYINVTYPGDVKKAEALLK